MEIPEKYGIAETGKDYARFDCERLEESESYIDVTEGLSAITNNIFLPVNVNIGNEGWTENREHDMIGINFRLKNENDQIRLL